MDNETETNLDQREKDLRLPPVSINVLIEGLSHFLGHVNAKGKARHLLELAYLSGHELTHKLNAGVVLCVHSGRSILTLLPHEG